MRLLIILIAIALGASVTLVCLIIFFDIPIFEKNIEITLNKFDCAKGFDQLRTGLTEFNTFSNTSVRTIDDNAFALFDNRCFTTYKSWMNDSDFFYYIKDNIIEMEKLSYQEQMYNHEIECEPTNSYICNLKESNEILK